LLNGYFAEDFHLVSEACAPYKGFTVGLTCADYSHCEKVAKIEKSGYIGGLYGNSSELLMMKEIRCRGPIVADFDVPLSFSYYTEGIFSDDHEKELNLYK
jgi:Papain family cysteine protease